MAEGNKRKRDITILVVLIAIAATVLFVRVHLTDKSAKEGALIDQLRAVRSSVQLYLTLNKSMPENLTILTTEKYTIGDKMGFYLGGVTVDNENYPLDAFGNRFTYNPSNGEVHSTTKGFESW